MASGGISATGIFMAFSLSSPGSFKKFESLTLDNGIENKHHEQLAFDVFFCDAYASWQKGGVEQSNGLIRRFIPKGANIAKAITIKITGFQATLFNRFLRFIALSLSPPNQ